jgi:PAS domain S-box-containing protein/putative nucleotidyltransferase with HDIG domain
MAAPSTTPDAREHLHRRLLEGVRDYAILSLDPEGQIVSWNAGARDLTGYSDEEALGMPLSHLFADGERAERLLRRARDEERVRDEAWWVRRDGSRCRTSAAVSLLRDDDGEPVGFAVVAGDVTERKEDDDELRRTVQRLRLHVEQTPLGAIDWDLDFRVVAWNPAAERIFGYSAEEACGQHASFIVPEAVRPLVDDVFHDLLRQEGGERSTNENITKDGRTIHCEWYNTPLVDDSGEVIGVASLVQDDTERHRAQANSRRQLEHLNALRAIDLAITASLDLRVTMTVLLDQVINQLRVDAADILLLNPHTQRLEYAAGRGFRTEAIQRSELLLGECAAGRAGLDRRTISMPKLKENAQFTRAELLCGEEFVSHHAAPLVAKGQVKGVLEVFLRTPRQTDPEWTGFLEALAGQAAIAVESARLFEDLQRSNLELSLAYDTTLEGWAHALDLRDSVTEGHTRRVTDMSMHLARALGVDDADLVHVRRGALLHDIGKIGVPDSILHKPGPLDDGEWDIMRKHPVYAFQLLRSIEFLRPALDIPYCHHERWDGGGYPRGLKGEEIPLAARIFAVVDVWDAIRSDRPYHTAWPEEKAREHIRSLAGTHLDPQVAEVFLSMEW